MDGFKYQKGYNWLDSKFEQRRAMIDWIQISEGRRLVGFEFEARRATIGGIHYQKGYDWLDSQFHCSYLESSEVPEKTC